MDSKIEKKMKPGKKNWKRKVEKVQLPHGVSAQALIEEERNNNDRVSIEQTRMK